MWIKINSDEIKTNLHSKIKSGQKTRIIASALLSTVFSSLYGYGLLISRSHVAANSDVGNFSWRRFVIGFVVMFPISYWLGKIFVRADVDDSVNLTVCIKCEKKSSGDDGATCSCGGEICSLARVKWID